MIVKIVSPDGRTEEFEFDSDEVVIGRSKRSDIVLLGDHISRAHLEIKPLSTSLPSSPFSGATILVPILWQVRKSEEIGANNNVTAT